MKRTIIAIMMLLAFWSTRADAAISYVNEWDSGSVANSFTMVINTSTGSQIQAGDVLIAFVTGQNPGTFSAPAGWSATVPGWLNGSTVAQGVVFEKVAGSGDIGASFTFGTAGGGTLIGGGLAAFRGVDNSPRSAVRDLAAARTRGECGRLKPPLASALRVSCGRLAA